MKATLVLVLALLAAPQGEDSVEAARDPEASAVETSTTETSATEASSASASTQPSVLDEPPSPAPFQLASLPSFRLDAGARIPVGQTTLTPTQFTMRLELGYDMVLSRWADPTLVNIPGLGLALRPHAAFRYDHMPRLESPARRLLAELGLGVGLLIRDAFIISYRTSAVLGGSGHLDTSAPVYGLRHGPEFGMGFIHRCVPGAKIRGLASVGVLGVSLTHEVLARPAPEQALAVTAWFDGIQAIVGFTNGMSFAYGTRRC
ncbi:hypothetical protein G6O69_05060 [Pseudenhygromyxa sp. WMMC2535]|uniref:hypothetical protein n=1 Tax=Pseudenhygromyxa sp. WMMC2535 TaxID=2712867 RepID=UPI0015580346|nr:hypothetical protein [Pseudenhygromyxa sp. WMMC2535]NVB37190.1 hypothetical protein [Pseudenhygromyxa sp. WMMC2535]